MAKYIVEIPDEVPVSDELVPFDMCRPSWYWEAYKKGKAEAEKEKEEIHVGDEVRCMDRVGIVVRIDSMDGGSNVVWEDGATAYIGVKDLTKTGRHFDEVEKLLERMKA